MRLTCKRTITSADCGSNEELGEGRPSMGMLAKNLVQRRGVPLSPAISIFRKRDQAISSWRSDVIEAVRRARSLMMSCENHDDSMEPRVILPVEAATMNVREGPSVMWRLRIAMYDSELPARHALGYILHDARCPGRFEGGELQNSR